MTADTIAGRAAAREFATQQVDLLVLSILARREATGAQVLAELEARAAGTFTLPAGVIYPALYRLAADGLLTSRAETADSRSVRLYQINETGRRAYAERLALWTLFAQKLGAFVEGGG